MTAAGRLPAGEVRAMFDRIAPRYDLLNRAMTAGLDGRWRRTAAALADVAAGDRALDVCTGTGDLAFALADRVTPSGEVVGVDFAERMLDRARAKAEGRPGLRFEAADALDLPFADDAFDAATVAFGIRNVDDLDRGIAEMARVVRPGGRVVILEITTPERMRGFYELWFDRVVPHLGKVLGRDGAAYAYLPASVRRFPPPPELAARMAAAGLRDIRWRPLAFGIVAIHHGRVA
ncbi:MAG TPA: bifunctional demethylmenaquinone methyltransferase/2-methoxy-6-polyprenyl-1,4-benzoquinol methylase UbiE [Miltoncostaea sp.]|nr:bifunctional demethylmenaquinone methyltransferase/2-methoxy-6-polyprenyl-1,4-benzoquinol methylase UbiE [Miltoncostaea sp.]